MTLNTDYETKLEQNNYNIFSRLFSRIHNLFSSKKKDNLPNFQINESKQSFYLQENISQNIYRIQPHQNFTIGPIIFKPFNKGKVSSTLFLKNNLTILYPIKLKGEGGSGQITFLNYLGDTKEKKYESFNNTNYIVEINRDIYENKMKYNNSIIRKIIINNSGNLPLVINGISVDGNECQTDDLKIIQCREFLIDVGESVEINFEISTNFNNAITNRVIKFQSDYQDFELNIIIIISKELCELNKHYSKFTNIIFIIIIPTLIFIYIVRKSINSDQITNKRESSIINGGQGHIESAKKLNIIKENEIKNKVQKKKGKYKKNKTNDIEKENNVIKNEKTAVNYKSIKTVIKSNENNKVKSETKTFGVIYINKDKKDINLEKDKNKKDISIINKTENKNNEKNEETKEIKNEKIPDKIINESNTNSEHKSSISDFEENSENIINYEYKNNKNNKQININNDSLNKNINQLLNSNNNISNNINIKININLSSKSNNTDSEESNIIQNNNNEKLIEANIIPESGKNENNYNYNIKIKEKLVKEKDPNKSSKSKTISSKKSQNSKKISNLKELLDDGKPTKKKSSNNKKKPKKLEKEVPIISEDIKEKEEEPKIPEINEINEINDIKLDEKIFDEKNSSNDLIKLNEDVNNENNEEDEFDFNKFDFFNSDKNKEKSENEEEKEKDVEEEDDEEDNNLNYDVFNDHIFSLYNNPFFKDEKKDN
jgi:hypothetical protein